MAISTNSNLNKSINVDNLESVFQSVKKNQSRQKANFFKETTEQDVRFQQFFPGHNIRERFGPYFQDKPLFDYPLNRHFDKEYSNDIYSNSYNGIDDRTKKNSAKLHANCLPRGVMRDHHRLPSEFSFGNGKSEMPSRHQEPFDDQVSHFKQGTRASYLDPISKIKTNDSGKRSDPYYLDHPRFPTTNYRIATKDPYIHNHAQITDKKLNSRKHSRTLTRSICSSLYSHLIIISIHTSQIVRIKKVI